MAGPNKLINNKRGKKEYTVSFIIKGEETFFFLGGGGEVWKYNLEMSSFQNCPVFINLNFDSVSVLDANG